MATYQVAKGSGSRKIVGGAILLSLLIVAFFIFGARDRSNVPSVGLTQPSPPAGPRAERQPQFVLADPVNPLGPGQPRFNLIRYDIRKRELRKKRLTLAHPLVDPLTAQSRNPLIQWSTDGQVMAYAIGQSVDPGDLRLNGPTRSYRLVVEQSGRPEAVVDGEESYRYLNWILAPSGKFIIVVRLKSEGPQYPDTGALARSVYKYDLASKQSRKLLDVNGYGVVDGTPMYMSADESQIIWLRYVGRDFRRLTLDLGTGKTDDKVIYVKAPNDLFPIAAHRDVLSPDHQLSVLREQDGPDWKIKLLDMESGKLTDLVNLGATHSPTSIRWSPDGSSIVYATAPYGARGPGRSFALAVIDIHSRAKTTIATNKTTDLRTYRRNCAGGLAPLGLSPDGQWLAYVKNCHLRLYNVPQKRPGATIHTFSRLLITEPPGHAWVGF